MKIFITGGTGFIGRHFVELLLNSDLGKSAKNIYLLSRSNKFHPNERISFIKGGIEDSEVYFDKLLKSDFLFHFAGKASLDGKSKNFDQNHMMTQTLIKILLQSSIIKKIIFISSVMAEGRTKTKYGISKAISERLIIDSGLPYVIFRPCFVYGDGMREDSHLMLFMRMVKNREFPVFLALPGRVSLIDVDDLCKAFLSAVNLDNGIYVATTETHQIKDIFRAMSIALNGKITKTFKIPKFICQLINLFAPFVDFKYSFPFTDYFLYDDKLFKRVFFPNDDTKKLFDSNLIRR